MSLTPNGRVATIAQQEHNAVAHLGAEGTTLVILNTRRAVVAIACLMAVAACGGGGSGSQQGSAVSMTLSTTSVDKTSNYDEPAPTASVRVSVSEVPASGLYVGTGMSGNAVARIDLLQASSTEMDVWLTFPAPSELAPGTYTSTVRIEVCYDQGCRRHVRNSPADVTIRYVVTRIAVVEPGLDPLPYVSRSALGHDVIDAEYSKGLESIVMVSSMPDNALYLYVTGSGTEYRVPLSRAPTSVSVSPDGRYAAVGHDARITHVDLQSVLAGVPVVKPLDVSTSVFDLVLDGRGVVHALPLDDQWVSVHSVDVATNTEIVSAQFIYEKARGRLHPSGDHMYTVDGESITPGGMDKYSLANGRATWMYGWPYHGDYDLCSDLWLKEDGSAIYTKCGNIFRASTTRDQDMVYSGRLQLSMGFQYRHRINSLSQSDASGEVLLTEYDWQSCFISPSGACHSHVATYAADSLVPSTVYSLPPISIGAGSYYQIGRFVFQGSGDEHRYLISQLRAAPAGTPATYLTVIR